MNPGSPYSRAFALGLVAAAAMLLGSCQPRAQRTCSGRYQPYHSAMVKVAIEDQDRFIAIARRFAEQNKLEFEVSDYPNGVPENRIRDQFVLHACDRNIFVSAANINGPDFFMVQFLRDPSFPEPRAASVTSALLTPLNAGFKGLNLDPRTVQPPDSGAMPTKSTN